MAPVKLYVYDLSNGMASQLSLQLTGRHIAGIWHTSIVVYGREIWYGQGINSSLPGKSHLGQPLEVIDLGETQIDEVTFGEYLNELKEHYTADKYHLLEFNCNSFTNDVAGFLTGGSIPSHIKDLPADFLSTPFGAALRPTIDSMYRRAPPGQVHIPPPPASSILQSVAAQAAATPHPITPSNPQPPALTVSATETVAAPIQICSNIPAFDHILASHRAVVAFFTSDTCPPCKMIEPTFEGLAKEKAGPGVGFVRIDTKMGYTLAGRYNVRATPTFLFFLDREKRHELKGADAPELRSQVNLLIYDAFPPHPHAKLELPVLRGTSLKPILFTQTPNYDGLSSKLLPSIEKATSIPEHQRNIAKTLLSAQVIPHLKSKAANTSPEKNAETFLPAFTAVTHKFLDSLPLPELFPLIDLWRIMILDTSFSTLLTSSPILTQILLKATSVLESQPEEGRNFVLTALRLASNIFSNPVLARQLLSPKSITPQSGLKPRNVLTSLLVPALLHTSQPVRVAAASLAFNLAAWLQKGVVELLDKGRSGEILASRGGEGVAIEREDADWEVEILSAIVEAIGREESEDIVHRLAAALGFLIHLSPHVEQVESLIEVLQTKTMLKEKNVKGIEVKKLILEIAGKLCP